MPELPPQPPEKPPPEKTMGAGTDIFFQLPDPMNSDGSVEACNLLMLGFVAQKSQQGCKAVGGGNHTNACGRRKVTL